MHNMNFVLVYGNHRHSLALLDDYIEYLDKCFTASGRSLKLSADPVSGAVNILIDQFDHYFVTSAQKYKTPGTRYVLVATEFITGSTFNNFNFKLPLHVLMREDASRLAKSIPRLIVNLVPSVLRDLIFKMFPMFYLKAKSRYQSDKGLKDIVNFSSLGRHWKERFECFRAMSTLAEEIWCVSPHQIESYTKLFGAKVKLLPIASWTPPATPKTFERDIDFLFTGTLTPYRKEIITSLIDAGFKVITGPASWPTALREHFLARTKVCLHLRQSADWQFPSIMRFHHLLTKSCVVLADSAPHSCSQESFVHRTNSLSIIEDAKLEIGLGDFNARGLKAATEYYKQSEAARNTIKRMLEEIDTN